MSEIATGSCLCGAIQFVYDGSVGAAAYCHCEDCRKCTGSAFNISVGVDAASFTITQGTLAAYTRTAESGNELTRHFCGACGSPIYTSSPVHPDRFYVKAGIFDDPALIRPSYQSWTRSAVPWAWIEADLPAHDTARDA